MATEDCKMVYETRLRILNDKALELVHAIDVMRETKAENITWGHAGQLGDAIKALDECLRLVK